MNKRRKIFFIFLILFFLYFSGFFFRPSLEYLVIVKLPKDVLILKDITLYIPFPYFTFFPYLKISFPLKEVENSFYVAAKTRNSLAYLENTKYGKMLKIYISKLSFADPELQTDTFKIHFTQNLFLPFFFTPFYLFKEPEKIYSLKPLQEKWCWREKRKNLFVAEKRVSTFIYSQFPEKEIFLKIKFRLKKRINPFGGYIIVQQEISDKDGSFIKIQKKGWQKYYLKEKTVKKWF